MDKVIINILSQKSGKDEPFTTQHSIGRMVFNHTQVVSDFVHEVKRGEMSMKQVKMLFEWSVSYAKRLEDCKSRFYPKHPNVKPRFLRYLNEVKALRGACRKVLERDLRHGVSQMALKLLDKNVGR